MRKIFQKSKETDKLVSVFRELSIGQTISFDDCSKVVGFEVTSILPAYHSARRIALRDHGIVIEGVRGVGFTRLNGEGMVDRGYSKFRSLRRMARRGAALAEVALRQNLPQALTIQATEQLSRWRITETTGQVSRPKTNRETVEAPPEAENFDTRAALKALRKAG